MLDVDAAPLRVLLSYWYFRDLNIEEYAARWSDASVVLDSGGFSADTTGAVIDPGEYATWVKRWGTTPEFVANLDVIGDAAGTWAMQQELERRGLRPTPSVHLGEPDDALRFYLDRGHRYICLGGMVGRPADACARWTTHCFQVAQPYGAVFHGFGVGGVRSLYDLPWYSVDCNSWAQGIRYGEVAVWDPRTHKFVSFPRSSSTEISATKRVRAQQAMHRRQLAPLLRRRGFDPAFFNSEADRDWRYAALVTVDSYRRLETWLRRRHGDVLNPETGEVGLRLYLAISVRDQVDLLRRGTVRPDQEASVP